MTRKHPTHKQRIAALQDPSELYRPSYEVALISGILAGLVLNSCIHLLAVSLSELVPLTEAINQFGQGLANSAFNLGLLRLLVVGFNLVLVLVAIALVAFLFGTGVLPLIATLGLQVQSAAFTDRVRRSDPRFLTLSHLGRLALMAGMGFVVGCLLVPIPKAFSLVGVRPVGLLGYVCLWTVTLALWLVPLAKLAGPLYSLHTGADEPIRKRQFLTRLSALALLPTFLTSSIAHVGFSVSQFDPGLLPVQGLGFILINVMVVGWVLQFGVWLVGWIMMQWIDWFRSPQCPHCAADVDPSLNHPAAVCPACGTPLAAWMRVPTPIQMPSPPAPKPVPTSAPPL